MINTKKSKTEEDSGESCGIKYKDCSQIIDNLIEKM